MCIYTVYTYYINRKIFSKFLNVIHILNIKTVENIVPGQKFAMNEIKIVISNILRKARIETLGSKEDIKIRLEVVIGIESIPKMIFYEI